MSLSAAVLVSLGAALGAVMRYGSGRLITSLHTSDFPWGTWLINMVGTLILGIFFRELESLRHDLNWWLLLGTGFCGGFTTFSTMSVEARELLRTRKGLAVLYLGSSLILGFVLAYSTKWI